MTKDETCDLCASHHLVKAYAVPGTGRGLSIYVCKSCGLVQSLPRVDSVPRRSAFPDSGAGFGNIRYGKGFRTEFALKTLAQHVDFSKVSTVLDVGANRGSFLTKLLEDFPQVQATAIEPDERVVGGYEAYPNISLVNARVEDVDLGTEKYDLVYHCHTLEHQAHPLSSLKEVSRALKKNGVMFLEVPNIAMLRISDIVEEWFIDKHLYHYSPATLCETVRCAGFELISEPDLQDETYITVLARKSNPKEFEGNVAEYEEHMSLLDHYVKTLARNQARLKDGAIKLETFCRENRVAVWGAGRIYTSLVDIGGFKPSTLCAVVDKNIYRFVSEMFGVAVEAPETLGQTKPEVVLVASRLYLDEIKSELSTICPNTQVLSLDDILEGNVRVPNVK